MHCIALDDILAVFTDTRQILLAVVDCERVEAFVRNRVPGTSAQATPADKAGVNVDAEEPGEDVELARGEDSAVLRRGCIDFVFSFKTQCFFPTKPTNNQLVISSLGFVNETFTKFTSQPAASQSRLNWDNISENKKFRPPFSLLLRRGFSENDLATQNGPNRASV